MKIKKATRKYEAWLSKHLKLLEADLELKHAHMAEDPFPFLRATFYRWAQVWPEVCPALAKAPSVLAVGDLHVENFGTWRDIEGRLVWGVNDFDETYPMAYTNDLVRLAVSAHLAIAANHLVIKVEDACVAILEGYREGLKAGGRPFVLEENHQWLREAATGELRDPVHFWEKMDGLPPVKSDIPKGARRGLEALMPEPGLPYRLAHRVAGLGSLGRERYVALAECRGGKGSQRILYEELITSAARSMDPFVHLRGRWIVRRLAPHCCRIELATLPSKRDEERLLRAMGFETANVHQGSKRALKAVRRDLDKRPPKWLHEAAQRMIKTVREDWEEWRKA